MESASSADSFSFITRSVVFVGSLITRLVVFALSFRLEELMLKAPGVAASRQVSCRRKCCLRPEPDVNVFEQLEQKNGNSPV
jgi:hypothetical protein